MKQRLLLASTGLLLLAASLPGVAAASFDRGSDDIGGHAPHQGVVVPHGGTSTVNADIRHRGPRDFWARWQALRCMWLSKFAPRLYEWVCEPATPGDVPAPTATPVPMDTPTPTPEPTFTPTPVPPTPIPTPTGIASFSGTTLVWAFAGVGSGNEWGFDTNPASGILAGGDSLWPDGTYNLSLSHSAGGSTVLNLSGVGPSKFSSRSVQPTCGNWDTIQIAIVDGAPGTTTEFRNVSIDGVSVGDLIDNGDGVPENDYWTFHGDYTGDVSVTGQFAVSGWGVAGTPRPRLEVTVGCG